MLSFLLLLALAATGLAQNFVQFINQDPKTTKNIVFTANAGLAPIATLVLGPSEEATQPFPDGWVGNWYSYNEGTPNVPGMLGEVAFGGFAGATYYDVSSIVNKYDTEGVKIIYPFEAHATMTLTELVKSTVVSGCQTSGCTNQYNAPNDKATMSTPGSGLVCLVGNLPVRTPGRRRHARDLVLSFLS